MHIVASNSELEAAWAAYDAARILVHKLYEAAAVSGDTPNAEQARREAAMEAVRCHRKWAELFLASDQNPIAA